MGVDERLKGPQLCWYGYYVKPRIRRESQSISEALNGTNNSFGAIRLVLASAVIISHAWPLGGYGTEPTHFLFQNQAHIGTIAVFGFMAISGYVVTKSAASTDILQFAWRRFLRMFPAFWLALIVTAFILGPIVYAIANDDLDGYFHFADGGPFTYVLRNLDLSIYQWGITGVFENLPTTSANGSLWTLAYEWGCYLLIGALAFIGVLRKAPFVIPAVALVFLLLQIGHEFSPSLVENIPIVGHADRVSLTLTFLWGATFAVYSRRIKFSNPAGIGAVVVLAGSLLFGGFHIIGLPALAYVTIWAAVVLPKRLHVVGAKTDYSYGIYLYGWPAQQLGVFLGWDALGIVPWSAISLLIAACCAWTSWHLLEKRAQNFKSVGPGKGLAYWVGRFKKTPTQTTLRSL